MSKIGVGVGEDFPIEDPPPPPPPPSDEERQRMERHWRWHRWLHIATRIALLGLIVAAIVWMFTGPHYADAAGGIRPYPHHFFFPFFPILFIVLLFALARRGCGWRGRWHHHHYHHHHYGDPREEA